MIVQQSPDDPFQLPVIQEVLPSHVLGFHHLDCSILLPYGLVGSPGTQTKHLTCLYNTEKSDRVFYTWNMQKNLTISHSDRIAAVSLKTKLCIHTSVII